MNKYNTEQNRYAGYDPNTDPNEINVGGTAGGSGVTDGGNGDGGNFDAEAWGNGIGSVLGGVGDLLGSLGVGGNTTNTTNLPTNGTTNGGNVGTPKSEDKKPNYTMWIIILAVIILLIAAFMMLRKKGGDK